jgi:phosphoadenosine phosphosulfate reductase
LRVQAKFDLLRAVRVQSATADAVTVLFSGGKDSVVTLDLCRKHFKRVRMAFMYYVPGLSFQERIIAYYENLFDAECVRVPHFELSEMLRYGLYRPFDSDVPVVSTRDIYSYIRELTGNYWLAGGERIADSIVRRAMLKRSGSVDEKRGRFYPLIEWTKSNVDEYIRKNRLKVSAESSLLGHSFRSLDGATLAAIRANYQEDFELIEQWFPLCEAEVRRYEDQAPDVRG